MSRMHLLPEPSKSRTALAEVPYRLPENSACSMKAPSPTSCSNVGRGTKWYSTPSVSPARGERVVSGRKQHISAKLSSTERRLKVWSLTRPLLGWSDSAEAAGTKLGAARAAGRGRNRLDVALAPLCPSTWLARRRQKAHR